MINRIEALLNRHEDAIRIVAAEERDKIKELHAELKIETGIASDLRVARIAMQSRYSIVQCCTLAVFDIFL